MDDFMMREYMKKKGFGNQGMMEKFRDFMEEYEDYPQDMEELFRRNARNARNERNERNERYERMRRNRYRREMEGMYPFMDEMEGSSMGMKEMFQNMGQEEKQKFFKMMLMEEGKSGSGEEHFNEAYAKFEVSKMYHKENGRKYVGEKFDMMQAKEICERYKRLLPPGVTHADVYVAINAQYHDYAELYKSWFGENTDQKIIESAINFWFGDDDYQGNKVWKYFSYQ